LDELLTWCHANGLVVNTKKSTAMLFHTWLKESFFKPLISFNNTDIEKKKEKVFWVYK
jgi:hypothetical protein